MLPLTVSISWVLGERRLDDRFLRLYAGNLVAPLRVGDGALPEVGARTRDNLHERIRGTGVPVPVRDFALERIVDSIDLLRELTLVTDEIFTCTGASI